MIKKRKGNNKKWYIAAIIPIFAFYFCCLLGNGSYEPFHNSNSDIILFKQDTITDLFIIPDTVYEIDREIDLKKSVLILPNNCELKFTGGSFKNGTLVGQNTMVRTTDYPVFQKGLNLEGTFDIDLATPIMFDAKGDGMNDDVEALNLMHHVSSNILYTKGNYLIDGTYCPYWEKQFQKYGGIWVQSNQKIDFETGAKIILKEKDVGTYCAFLIKGKDNITINNAHLIGYYYNGDTSWKTQHGHGIYITSSCDNFASVDGHPCRNIVITNYTAERFKGDAINLSKGDEVEIKNVKGIDIFRDVITLGCCQNVNIKNVTSIKQKYKGVGGPVIDLETDFENCYYKNIYVNGVVASNVLYGINVVPYRKCEFSNVVFENITFNNILYKKSKESRGFCYFLNHPENYNGRIDTTRTLYLKNWTFNGYRVNDQFINNVGLSYGHYLMYLSGWSFYGYGSCLMEDFSFKQMVTENQNNDALFWFDTHGLDYGDQFLFLKGVWVDSKSNFYLVNNQGSSPDAAISVIITNASSRLDSPFKNASIMDIVQNVGDKIFVN